jgi:Tol biopolymer transport system component
MVFQAAMDANEDIYRIEYRSGEELQLLTNNIYRDMKPVWSPDGQSILFESERDGNPELYRMDSLGMNVTRLTDNDAKDWAPSWSPNGNQIVFISNRDVKENDYQIYVMMEDGSNVKRLTNNEFDDRNPVWSPDGKRIVFMSDRPDGVDWDIYVMSAAGEDVKLTQLTESPGDDQNPAWTPDGTKILFDSDREGNREIYIMDSDGSNQQRLFQDPADDIRPRCCPYLEP